MPLPAPRLTVWLLPLLLCSGCSLQPRQQTVPDTSVPHRTAADQYMDILVDLGNGHFGPQRVFVPAGWWVASPNLVEKP
jgi:hypothetical protein